MKRTSAEESQTPRQKPVPPPSPSPDLSGVGPSREASIANWIVPGKLVKGVGGAMDLVAGTDNVIVAMQHMDKKGTSKLLKKCRLPQTGVSCIQKIVTDMGVIEVTPQGFLLTEIFPGLSKDDLQNATEAELQISPDLKPMFS